MKYVIVTPAKNEEDYIEYTLKSVISQTKRPLQWIILDDNSTDNTGKIVRKYTEEYDWIRLINICSLTIEEISTRIAYLVNQGVIQVKEKPIDIIMKLDADVSFDSSFCQNVISEFERNPRLGIASGNIIYEGEKENNSDDSLTRGATKFYRKQCWEQIGGVYLSRGWDTIDNYAAQYYGWDTKKLNYYFRHHKKEGRKSGLIRMHYWTGLYNGRVPYHFLFFFLKLLYHFFDKPLFLSTLIQFSGYVIARYIKKERPFPEEISNYVRKKQAEKIRKALLG